MFTEFLSIVLMSLVELVFNQEADGLE